ncbi:hypothetical protein HPB48_007474 [Haemaphysalis longicornis]|uniref:Uncharacterized protein n=1 Tax=Haemaphysalis longicornis TaxID=44386 RepID=A0A9J6GHP1_HAELO|nr:hypothetical protein HPB48_007474 [Haemaphysalis longicornis]
MSPPTIRSSEPAHTVEAGIGVATVGNGARIGQHDGAGEEARHNRPGAQLRRSPALSPLCLSCGFSTVFFFFFLLLVHRSEERAHVHAQRRQRAAPWPPGKKRASQWEPLGARRALQGESREESVRGVAGLGCPAGTQTGPPLAGLLLLPTAARSAGHTKLASDQATAFTTTGYLTAPTTTTTDNRHHHY